MDRNAEFAHTFGQKLDADLVNLKLFINPARKVSADEIRADAVAFQKAIDESRVAEVTAVD